MPTLITRGVSSAYAFGLTTATGGRFGWMSKLTSSVSLGLTAYAVRVASTGSYVLGLRREYAEGVEYLVTLDSTGTTISAATVFQDSPSNLANSVVDILLDSSDNIYSIGRRVIATPSCCGTFTYAYWNAVSKTNASSSNLGSTYFGTGNASAGYFTNISKFSDGTILICGFTFTNNAWPAIVKLNSALTTVSWGFQKNSNVYLPVTASIDASDNVLALQVENSSSRLNILSITSAGSITYKKFLNGFSAYFWSLSQGSVSKPVFDASTNSYFTGNYFYQVISCCTAYYYPRSMLLSLDSTSSTLRFAKGYVSSGGAIQGPTTPAKDSSDNMYFASYYTGAQGTGTIIIKTNSSGVLQWARTITQSGYPPTTPTTGVTDIAVDGTNFVLSMSGGGASTSVVLKMPTDGSGGGTTFALGGLTYVYGIPTDFSVVDLTGLTVATDTSSSWTSYTPTLTTTGLAPAASTVFTVTNKKI